LLSEFVHICRENRTTVEEIFSEALRSDLERKPATQLGRFLRRAGLRLTLSKTGKTATGGKVRYYSLDTPMAERMMSLAASYLALQKQKEIERETKTWPVA
jgi:hypothetical protein